MEGGGGVACTMPWQSQGITFADMGRGRELGAKNWKSSVMARFQAVFS